MGYYGMCVNGVGGSIMCGESRDKESIFKAL